MFGLFLFKWVDISYVEIMDRRGGNGHRLYFSKPKENTQFAHEVMSQNL